MGRAGIGRILFPKEDVSSEVLSPHQARQGELDTYMGRIHKRMRLGERQSWGSLAAYGARKRPHHHGERGACRVKGREPLEAARFVELYGA
jgi:hypothetical protein